MNFYASLSIDVAGIYLCLFFQTENQRSLYGGLGASLPLIFIVLQCNYLFGMLISSLYIAYSFAKGNYTSTETTTNNKIKAHVSIFFTSLFQIFSQIFSNAALKTVEFPVKLLFRSCKPITVVLFALLLSSFGSNYIKKPGVTKYIQAGCVTFSIFVFFKIDFENKGDEFNFFKSGESQGIILLTCSLIFDGLVNTIQSYRRVRFKSFFSNFAIAWFFENFYQAMILFVLRWYYDDKNFVFTNLFGFLGEKNLVGIFFLCSSLNSIAQLFIYRRMNTKNGTFVLSLILTTRKMVSFVFGVLCYRNFGGDEDSPRMKLSQWGCVAIIFGSLMCEKIYSFMMKRGKEKV